jgi:hypothetical protein
VSDSNSNSKDVIVTFVSKTKAKGRTMVTLLKQSNAKLNVSVFVFPTYKPKGMLLILETLLRQS